MSDTGLSSLDKLEDFISWQNEEQVVQEETYSEKIAQSHCQAELELSNAKTNRKKLTSNKNRSGNRNEKTFISLQSSLGIGNKPHQHEANELNSEDLFWLREPQDVFSIPKYVQSIRQRLIRIERRIKYLKNEKRSLLSSLWGLSPKDTSEFFKDSEAENSDVEKESISNNEIPHKRSSVAIDNRLPIIQNSPQNNSDHIMPMGYFKGTESLSDSVKHFAQETAACKNPSTTPVSLITGEKINHTSLSSLMFSRPSDTIKKIENRISLLNTISFERILPPFGFEGTSMRPEKRRSCDKTVYETPDTFRAQQSSYIGRGDANALYVSSEIPYENMNVDVLHEFPACLNMKRVSENSPIKDFMNSSKSPGSPDNLVNNGSESQEINVLYYEKTGVNDDFNIPEDPEKIEIIDNTELASSPVSDLKLSEKRSLKRRKKISVKEIAEKKYTVDYWENLDDSTLRHWMCFFGMKVSKHWVTRKLMINELSKISSYVYSN